ncbi:MAG: phosphoenolpyruvate carboxykinase (ATP) [Clostridia bacterium]|nr:phosphoenolpyruvate carboxykinase (ATP) [Clostridia bacterium]
MHSFRRSVEAKAILDNPSLSELRELARKDERTTEYGSASYITNVRSRSAKFTYIVEDGVKLGIDQQGIPLEKAMPIADEVHRYLRDQELIRVDRRMGLSEGFSLHCRLYISKGYARIPYQWQNMLFEPVNKDEEPDLISIYVPEWPERIIFCHPEAGVTYILGTDYFGECKKSFLRKAMYYQKNRGGIGLHAGSKVIQVKDKDGKRREVGFILFGLSGTGKTTLTMHDHDLEGDEGVAIRQDDVIMLNPDGSCFGTENGFYIKTDGLDESQAVLYNAAISPQAIFENIMVLKDGSVFFDNKELTSNGRGVVLRSEVIGTDDKIDLVRADRIIFITRRDDVVPAVAKLSAEQAAAFFMLGESIETSAGDPTKAGQAKRQVGTNPFIVGSEAEEGNRFLEIIRKNPGIECYLLNTGSVGKNGDFPGVKIKIKDSTTIMKQIARGVVRWQEDPDWGYLVPVEVPGIDIKPLDPHRYYSLDEYDRRNAKLREERRFWLAKYTGLKAEIVLAIEPEVPVKAAAGGKR